MATSGWVDNNKYYVDGSGKWVKNPSKAQLATKPGSGANNSNNNTVGPIGPGDRPLDHTNQNNGSNAATHEHKKVVDQPSYSVYVCACGMEFDPDADEGLAEHQKEMHFAGIEGHGASSTKKYKEQSHYECSICGVHK